MRSTPRAGFRDGIQGCYKCGAPLRIEAGEKVCTSQECPKFVPPGEHTGRYITKNGQRWLYPACICAGFEPLHTCLLCTSARIPAPAVQS